MQVAVCAELAQALMVITLQGALNAIQVGALEDAVHAHAVLCNASVV